MSSPEYREYTPAPQLRPWVECYWSSSGVFAVPRVRAVLPDGCMDIVIAGTPDQAPGALVVGTQRRAFLIRLDGRMESFGIRFRPAGLPAVLPVPAEELVDQSVALADLVRPAASRAFDRLADAPPAQRPALADAALLRLLEGLAPDRFVARAILAVHEHHGSPGTRALADRMGMSPRTLERRFRATVGLGPGTLARILRFRRAADRMAARPEMALGRIAHEAGYADQSHFNRDVRTLTGHTPRQLRRIQWGG